MKKKAFAALFLAAVLILGLFGCTGKSGAYTEDMAEDGFIKANGSGGIYGMASDSGSTMLQADRKQVKTVSLEAETEDLEALLTELNRQIEALGGYVEQRNVYNGSAYETSHSRYASLVIRIPADRVSEFVTQVSEASNIVYNREKIDDITLEYVDTESRMTALQTEQTRLLELMEKAETMSDLLEIEERLTEVRYELENITSQLRVYDNQVDYATVNLDVDEVRKLTPVEKQSVWQRMGSGFVENLKNLGDGLVELLVLLVAGLPYLVVIAAAAVVLILLIRRSVKRKKLPIEKGNQDAPEERQ